MLQLNLLIGSWLWELSCALQWVLISVTYLDVGLIDAVWNCSGRIALFSVWSSAGCLCGTKSCLRSSSSFRKRICNNRSFISLSLSFTASTKSPSSFFLAKDPYIRTCVQGKDIHTNLEYSIIGHTQIPTKNTSDIRTCNCGDRPNMVECPKHSALKVLMDTHPFNQWPWSAMTSQE